MGERHSARASRVSGFIWISGAKTTALRKERPRGEDLGPSQLCGPPWALITSTGIRARQTNSFETVSKGPQP